MTEIKLFWNRSVTNNESANEATETSRHEKQADQTRGEERGKAILDTGESLLNRKSFEQISLGEIIKRAKVNKGMLYHFFESKQSVFLSIMHRVIVEVDSSIVPLPGEEKLEFIDYILKIESRLEKLWKNTTEC